MQDGSTTYARYSGFNAWGQPSSLTLGNGVTTTYTYDKGGNVTRITDPRHGTQTYTYDALDRLTKATNAATGGYGTIDYTYNQIGNLTRHSKVGTYAYPASGASSTRPHAVASTSLTTGSATTTTTYRYDANGNLTAGGGRTLTWDAENRPTQIVKGDATTTFGYDGDGGRVKKTVSTTQAGTTTTSTTVYIGQLYVCTGTACAKLIYGGHQRVALVQGGSGAISYFHGDHLGSTSVLTNASGTGEERNSYQPYGALHTHTGTSDVAYKYTGQERDVSTALYFYRARYYDQELGRFTSPDPIIPNVLDPQAFNRYAYVRNNPLRYVDPTGYAWDDWLDWGPWDVPGFGDGYWNPPAGPIDNPVTGVPMLDEVLVQATPLPPESRFLDFLGRDPWGLDAWIPPVSDPRVTLVGGDFRITEEQRALATQGRYQAFWHARLIQSGDPVAWTALSVLYKQGLGGVANLWVGLHAARLGLTVDMGQLANALVEAHIWATDRDTAGVRGLLHPEDIARYHHKVFLIFGLPPNAFAGTPFTGTVEEANYTGFLWCPGCDPVR